MTKIKITKRMVDKIFETAKNQFEAAVELYKLAYPDFDELPGPIAWPKTSKEVHVYLFDKFIEFDKKNHPEVFPGGLWLNRSFSSDEKLEGWVIDVRR